MSSVMYTMPYVSKLDETRTLLTAFDTFGRRDDLDMARENCRAALEEASQITSDPSSEAEWLALQGLASVLSYEEFVVDDDFETALRLLEVTATKYPVETRSRALGLYGLGRLYAFRAIQSPLVSPADLQHLHQRSIVSYQEALKIVREDPAAVSFLSHQELKIRTIFSEQRLLLQNRAPHSSYTDCWNSLQHAISSLPESHACFAYAQSLLAQMSWNMHCYNISMEYLDALFMACSKVLATLPSHRLRFQLLALQGYATEALHANHSQSADCMNDAIALVKEAVSNRQLVCPHDVRIDKYMEQLCRLHINRFFTLGDLADLDAAVDHVRAVHYPTVNLCAALGHRYRETGHREDLDEAVDVIRSLIGREESPYVFMNLGSSLFYRYKEDRHLKDFEESKKYLMKAIATSREGQIIYFGAHTFLARLFQEASYPETGEAHLEMAVSYYRRALALMPEGDVDIPSGLSELGAALSTLGQKAGSDDILEEGTQLQQQALRLCSSSSGERHRVLHRLASTYRCTFDHRQTLQDLQQSIELLSEAVSWAKETHHPLGTLYLSDLASCYMMRYQWRGTHEDRNTALHLFEEAAFGLGYVKDRLQAAILGARTAQTAGLFDCAMTLYSVAVSLLPQIAWLGHHAEARQAQLALSSPGFVSDAAACAIMVGSVERAVEFLDEGRSILWQSVLGLRSDLQELEHTCPDLATRFRNVSRELEEQESIGDNGSSNPVVLEQRAHYRHRLAERWNDLLHQIRRLDRFDSFLKPLSFKILQQAARDGPVVLLNVSTFRTDAIIVTINGPVRLVPLPHMSTYTVYQHAYAVSTALQTAKDAKGCEHADRTLLSVLRGLWGAGLWDVAGTLYELQHATMARVKTRVWWIPTGLLNLLPIHCVGPYDDETPGLAESFISSYSTSISALLRARSPKPMKTDPATFLSVSCNAPGHPPLPCAAREVAVVQDRFGAERVETLSDEEATMEAVFRGISEAKWLHLTCHGHSNHQYPLQSGFRLHDGSLSMGRIMQLNVQHAEFAFLSACHTARCNSDLADESLHLAAGLQVAGFRGLVATKWAMADIDGPVVASLFYASLTATESTLDATRAAEALHHAVLSMRANGVPTYRWATFVHIGL